MAHQPQSRREAYLCYTVGMKQQHQKTQPARANQPVFVATVVVLALFGAAMMIMAIASDGELRRTKAELNNALHTLELQKMQ